MASSLGVARFEHDGGAGARPFGPAFGLARAFQGERRGIGGDQNVSGAVRQRRLRTGGQGGIADVRLEHAQGHFRRQRALEGAHRALPTDGDDQVFPVGRALHHDVLPLAQAPMPGLTQDAFVVLRLTGVA